MVLPLAEPTDEEILARVSGGDVESFELVMRRYNRRLFRAVRAILKDDAEVEDVIQEAYVSAYAHLADFSGRARFSTWLTRIAIHEAFGRLRKRRRSEPLDAANGEDDAMLTPVPSPEKHASDGELRKVLEQAVDTLPETFRTVFVLRAVEQLSVAETSEVLGIPEDTVKTRLHRARGLLQSRIEAHVGDRVPDLYDFQGAQCDAIVAKVLGRLKGQLGGGAGAPPTNATAPF
jgi:RNA polymerase sigma-70 factor (ECF subfamily)